MGRMCTFERKLLCLISFGRYTSYAGGVPA